MNAIISGKGPVRISAFGLPSDFGFRVSAFLLCALLPFLPFATPAAPANHPNIVIILADDQGWGDLSVNGNSNLSTPRIDSLAKDGALLERFYACPVCSPRSEERRVGKE